MANPIEPVLVPVAQVARTVRLPVPAMQAPLGVMQQMTPIGPMQPQSPSGSGFVYIPGQAAQVPADGVVPLPDPLEEVREVAHGAPEGRRVLLPPSWALAVSAGTLAFGVGLGLIWLLRR